MKNILLSLFTIATITVVVFGTSNAFFSDRETSTNNTFIAGAVDLKVDSEGHYNGLVCRDGQWVNDCVPIGQNLITNGGFEKPPVVSGDKWDVFTNGTTDLAWTVEWQPGANTYNGWTRPAPALQELQKGVNGWSPQEGNQWTEMDSDWNGHAGSLDWEPALVKIHQNVATEIGKKYIVTFHYSPRPNLASGDNSMDFRVNDALVSSYTPGAGGSNTNWTKAEHEFTATSSTTKIEFAGTGTNNSYGLFLDGVSMYELKCNSDFAQYEGRACASTWELTDLGSINKFWDFDDIKPGDFGENTISMHVADNDAYACMYFNNLHDDDPSLTEPETQAGDSSQGQDQGELSKNIEIFMWRDSNGNNVWDELEVPLTQGEYKASVAFNSANYPLAVPPVSIPAGVTNYVGISWCAGDMTVDSVNNIITCSGSAMGNEAQTDVISVDVSFYVEQSRNNGAFVCPTF